MQPASHSAKPSPNSARSNFWTKALLLAVGMFLAYRTTVSYGMDLMPDMNAYFATSAGFLLAVLAVALLLRRAVPNANTFWMLWVAAFSVTAPSIFAAITPLNDLLHLPASVRPWAGLAYVAALAFGLKQLLELVHRR